MQIIVVLALLLVLDGPIYAQKVESNYASSDLSTMKIQFQSLLNELDPSSPSQEYEASVANLLNRLDNLQRSSAPPQNISFESFYGGTGTTDQQRGQFLATPMRIVIVVSSFEGMYLNSGIGTFYAGLSDFLVSHGHSVTVLYTRTENFESKTFQRWKTSFERKGIAVAHLDTPPVQITTSPLSQRSYQVYTYLKSHQEDFDIVHLPDWEGPGYYSLLARHEGLAFQSKMFIVGLHGPWRWVKRANQGAKEGMLSRVEDLETDWMERKSCELADIVWSPSQDLVQWLVSQGWNIPSQDSGRLFLMPLIPGREIVQVNQKNSALQRDVSSSVTELVFFGRLEMRKGIAMFADALDRLTIRRPEFLGLKVTFLGRSTVIDGVSAGDYLAERAKKGGWPYRVSIITHKDRKGALEYMREKGRLAVIPSLMDNAPYTVYECLFSNTPFIASKLSSISALINEEDRPKALFDLDAFSLVDRLEDVLDNGPYTIRSTLTVAGISDSWAKFYDEVATLLDSTSSSISSSASQEQPLVTVCITHYNRPDLLRHAIASVQAQTYSNFDVVLVDDGSDSLAAQQYIGSLQGMFDANGWQIIRTPNQYLGAARNTAARSAKGQYLLFLDDDNLAAPEQIATYVSVAKKTSADILTAPHYVFRGLGSPETAPESNNIVSLSIPLGASITVGLFRNCYGDANFFVRKSAFVSIGGFTEDRGVGQEDREFFTQAILSGFSLWPVPVPLLYYRMHNQTEQMLYTTDSVENTIRAARGYKKVAPQSDILQLIAYSQVHKSRTTPVCNMSILAVNPNNISTLTPTTLVFNVSNYDCTVTTLSFGSYDCTNIIPLSTSSFSCLSPGFGVAGDYPISVAYQEAPTLVATSLILHVYNKPLPPGSSVAIVSLVVTVNPALYSQAALLALLAQLAGIDLSSLQITYDVVTTSSKRDTTENRNLLLSITSDTSSVSAATLANNLLVAVENNAAALAAIGVVVDKISFNSHCDSSGKCTCSANYGGVGCTTPLKCPNNCDGHGTCVNGEYDRICECDAGWTGRDCSSGLCAGDCSGNGDCVIIAGQNGTCSCFAGFTGDECSEVVPPSCPGSPMCSNQGTCVSGSCVCNSGFSGSACNLVLEKENNNSNTKGIVAFAVVVAVVGVILLAAVIIAAYIIVRRRRQ